MRENQIKELGNYHFVGKTLGKGHFGFVELAVHSLTNIKVAVKITEIHGEKAAIVRRNCHREVSTLSKLNHPCIVKLHETFKAKNTFCLVMEYVDGGDLLTFVREKPEGKLVEEDARWYFEQIVSVLDYLHQRFIVHRDLKLENILLHGAEKRMVKIIDFGFSNAFSKGEFLSTKCGSPEYAAPELFRKDCKYGTEVDIWSLGIVLYAMLVGHLPFRNGNYGKLVSLISKGLTSVHQEKMKNLNAECVVLLTNILQPESSRRYTIQNIMAHSWLSSGRKKLAIFRSPDVNRSTKQKLIKATADMMELSRTEVSLAVEAGQCDSIFAVYNILLQEELKQKNNDAQKTVSSLVIRDHSNTTRLTGGTAEKRRKIEKNNTKMSQTILQKSRLQTMQAKRLWAIRKRVQIAERKTFDGVSCVIGQKIAKPTTDENSSDGNKVANEEVNNNISKEVTENLDSKCEDLPGPTFRNVVEQTSACNEVGEIDVKNKKDVETLTSDNKNENLSEKSSTTSQTTAKEEDLKKDNSCRDDLQRNETFLCQGNSIACKPRDHLHDGPYRKASYEKYVHVPTSVEEDISNSTSSCSLEGIAVNIGGITLDKVTESPIATPSLATSSLSNILSLIGDEQCQNGQVWMDVDNKDSSCTSQHSEVQSGIQNVGATCVTLQVMDVQMKSPPVKQKVVGPMRFKSAERKGSSFSTIPTKKTVNPSKDLEEAIEERLKPCLKNSAASLRERPHTANGKVCRKPVQSESDVCVSNGLPPRPQTVATSHRRGRSFQGKNSSSKTWSQDKSQNGAWKARRTRKTRPRAKVNSWLEDNDSVFKISGKKIHVEGSSDHDENTNKSSETQQRGTIIVPSHIPGHSSAADSLSETKDTSSIKIVVGKRCFKKEKKVKNTTQKDEVIDDVEEVDSNSDMTDYVTAWLSRLEIDSKKAEKSGSMDSFQKDVNNCDQCRIKSASCKNRSDKSNFVSKGEVHGNDRLCKSSKESVAAKWNAVEKIMCTGQKMNAWTMEQIIQSGPLSQNESVKKEGRMAPVCVPSVTISINLPQPVVPNPSVDTLKYGDECNRNDVANRERIRKCHNSSVGFVGNLEKKTRNVERSACLAGTKEYWNQISSSELEENKLAMGSKEWMDAHLTAVLDKAKMTRELCRMR